MAISHAAKSPPVEMRSRAVSRSPSCARERISSSDSSRRANSSGHSERTLYAPLPSGSATLAGRVSVVTEVSRAAGAAVGFSCVFSAAGAAVDAGRALSSPGSSGTAALPQPVSSRHKAHASAAMRTGREYFSWIVPLCTMVSDSYFLCAPPGGSAEKAI